MTKMVMRLQHKQDEYHVSFLIKSSEVVFPPLFLLIFQGCNLPRVFTDNQATALKGS